MFQNLPTFKDGVGQILSAGLHLNKLRDNTGLLDALSFRTVSAIDSSATLDTGTPGKYRTALPMRVWLGYFKWRTGMTTLTVFGRKSAPVGVSLKVYVNGSGTAAATITANTFSQDIDISTGYTNGQIVKVEVKASGTGDTSTSTFVVGAYVSPISKSSWPGVPTFTTATINASKLNQLYNAQVWLYDRINMVPMVPSRLILSKIGPFRPSDIHVVYVGQVVRGYSADSLRVHGYALNQTSPGMRYKIYLNNVLTATSSTFGTGWHEIDETISLSGVSVGDYAEVIVKAEVVTAAAQSDWKQSRWSLDIVGTTGSYTYATLPDAFAYGSMTPANLVTALNSLSTSLSTVKSRIDAAPHIFSRAPVQRWWYGYDDNTDMYLPKRATVKAYRRGDILTVYGKDVKLGWGPATFTYREDRGFTDYDDYSYQNTEQIIDADKVETKDVYLDSYPSLLQGQKFFVLGENCYYVEELLR